MAQLRAARSPGELASQLVVFVLFGLTGLLCLATRHETRTVLVGLWLVAFSFTASVWAVCARTTWARGRGEDLITSPGSAGAIYARAGVELLFILGVGFFFTSAETPEWKKALFFVAGVISLSAILVRAWRALRDVRKAGS